MPSFGTVAPADINPLASYGTALQNQFNAQAMPARNQLLTDQAQSADQDLADRGTLRELAGGLGLRDPLAQGQASVLAGGGNAITSLSGADTAAATAALARAHFMAMLPDAGAPPVGGAPADGTPGPGASADPSSDTVPGLARAESGNDPTAVNAGGYSGMFQQGAARLSDLGVGIYTPAKGENVNSNTWGGTFNIPGFPNVKTHADFLQSPGAQKVALAAEVADSKRVIAQTPGTAGLDQTGLLAVAHLGGNAGMQRFVSSGGLYNPADSNGTRLSDYYSKYSGPGGLALLQATHGHPDGPPAADPQVAAAAPGAPGVTLSPDSGVPGPAPNGAPTATRGPMPGDTMTDATSGAPAPGTQGVGDVMARLRAQQPGAADPGSTQPTPSAGPPAPPILDANGQPLQVQPAPSAAPTPPAVANPNGLLPLAQIDTAAPAPANGLAAPVAPRPQLMPAASAQPPNVPPNGSIPLRNPLTKLPYTEGAAPGNAWYQLPNGSRQQFPMPGGPPNIDYIKTEDAIVGIDKNTGKQVSSIPITSAGRITMVPTSGGTQPTQNGQPMGPVIPYSGRPEQTDAYKGDLTKVDALTTAAQSAQASMPRLNEMATLAGQLATGPTADTRAKGAALLEAAGVAPETIKAWTGMPSGAAAQEFIKLSIATAGSAAKADVGANNGIQSTQLYQAANPNLSLLPDANKRITNMMRVSAQSIQDYAQAALQHFGDNETTFLGNGPGHVAGNYVPLTAFNRVWQSQANPQVYAAATGILNGDPFDKWSAKISPAEGARAAQIAAHIDPTVMVPMRGGGMRPVGQVLGHPAISGAQAPPAAPN